MILEGTRRKRTTGFIRANDGVRLYYEEMGQGRPILLIHGGGLSMAWWRKQIPVLATQFRVIAADTRGNGRSDKTAWGHRTARYAMDVREVIEALDLNGVTLVGWSIGARTVLSYLELFRGYRLNGAVLVDEVPCLALHEPVVHDDEAETEDGAAEDEMVRLRLGFRQMFATEISEEELDWMVDETKGNSPDQSVTLGPDYKAQDWRPLLPSIDLPMLIVTGKQSGAYPGCLYMAETIPNAQLVTCEQSGHAPFYDEPVKFNAAVAEFVANALTPLDK